MRHSHHVSNEMREMWERIPDNRSRIMQVVTQSNKAATARYDKFIGRVPACDMYRKMELQGWKCMYCKISISFDNCEIDHVIPIAKGGEHYLYNLVFACQFCNRKKSAKSLKRFCNQMYYNYEEIVQEMADINQKLHDEVFGHDYILEDVA